MRKQIYNLLFLMLCTAKVFAFQPSPVAEDEYDAVRNKWKDVLTGVDAGATGKHIEAKKAAITSEAQKHWTALNKLESRTYLWTDLSSTTLSAHITHSYRRIYAMALAYSTIGTALYGSLSLKSDIIGALEWMSSYRYAKSYNDWWDFAIGAPLELNNCITLLYDDLSKSQRDSLNGRVAKFAGDPATDFGANRAWRAFVYGLNGVLKKDSSKILVAKNALSALFSYVSKGEGFYNDGSFIQHANHPYNLGYGVDVIAKISDLFYLLNGTTWEVTDSNKNNLYSWIYNSFEPFIYKGVAMDMVRGREMARWNREDYKAGFSMTGIVAKLAQFAPPADAANFKRLVKWWVTSNRQRDYFSDAAANATTSLHTIKQVQMIVEDASISPIEPVAFYRQFPMMDRAVKFGNGFAFGISMYSARIANYEADIKEENLQGWHTGNGMTYLYNADLNQYSNAFWPTVNNHRLPGTTVLQQLPVASDKVSDRHWVGGVALEKLYGVCGMDCQTAGYQLKAKKSWFLFDDEIVALGAGIESNDNNTVETIVENRKLDNGGTAKIMLNGKAIPSLKNAKETAVNRITFAHLSGQMRGADIGYYFPKSTLIKTLREKRTGNWTQLNGNPAIADSATHANYFFTMWIDHGLNPGSAKYAYVLLPGKSANETAGYAKKPQINILRNDTMVQAVKEKNLQIIGANFWTDTEQTVDMIGCNKKAAVMVKTSATEMTVSVADPTMLNSDVITVTIARPSKGIVGKSNKITIVQLTPTVVFNVHVSGANGGGFEAKFKL